MRCYIHPQVGGSLAKVVYFTRSRSSSDAKKPEAEGKRSSAGSPGLPQLAAAHSRYRSHENGEPPSTPPLQSGESSYPMPSGTLTPTAILNSPLLSTSMSAIQSTFLKRRSLPSALPGGRLNFIKFETSDIESCVRFLKELIETSARTNGVTIEEMRRGVKLMATGGGAHLFYDLFEIELGVEVRREDEMGCLITGLNFITLIPDEVFWYSDELIAALHNPLPKAGQAADPQIASSSRPVQDQPLPRPSPNPPLYMPVFDKNPSPKLPCLLVNIGSGVSIIKVDDYGKFERVSGTSLGGGTLWGLLSLLTDAQSFDGECFIASRSTEVTWEENESSSWLECAQEGGRYTACYLGYQQLAFTRAGKAEPLRWKGLKDPSAVRGALVVRCMSKRCVQRKRQALLLEAGARCIRTHIGI